MALKAGRVGVAKDQVDEFGHITGSTPENVYTKSQCDNKFELKSHIGGLKFRDNDGTAQYQLPNGEWTNFSSGGAFESIWRDDTPPDPSVHFNAQTINVDLTGKTEFIIKSRVSQYSSYSDRYTYDLFVISDLVADGEHIFVGVNNSAYGRKVNIVANGISIGDCSYNGGSPGSGYNANCIPVEILAK